MLKVSGGEETELQLRAMGTDFVGTWAAFSETITQQPISVRLIKKGHEYRAAVRVPGDVDKTGNPNWFQTGSVSSLHPPKTFVMNASQQGDVKGESTFYINSVKIEALP